LPLLHALAHANTAAAHHHGDTTMLAASVDDAEPSSDRLPGHSNTDGVCTHAHAHCCAAAAILAAGSPQLAPADPGRRLIERNAALPFGQLLSPPLRPPRRLA
jgi:hypothetical protein